MANTAARPREFPPTPTLAAAQNLQAPAQLTELDTAGYVVIPEVITAEHIGQINEEIERIIEASIEADIWQSPYKRHVEDLVDAGSCFDQVWLSPLLHAVAADALGGDYYMHGMRYRAPIPGHGAQKLHTDDDPARKLDHRLVTVIVAVTDFTAHNGATRVIPGSHRAERSPTVPSDPDVRHDEERLVLCAAGSAIVFTGSLWHSGTLNDSPEPRGALAISYVKRRAGLPAAGPASAATLLRLGADVSWLSPNADAS
jgi:ectoine hydroxylase-related dioxygenase (phytanoyl-CoA dioxygenase family)